MTSRSPLGIVLVVTCSTSVNFPASVIFVPVPNFALSYACIFYSGLCHTLNFMSLLIAVALLRFHLSAMAGLYARTVVSSQC